jgi:hypothetical protein
MHHHIFKNAGTTFDWVLNRNFPGRVVQIEGDQPGSRLSPNDVLERARLHPRHRAITSHTCPLPGSDSMWARFHVTFLRDPIERLYSAYRFSRRRADDYASTQAAKDASFRGYCEWWLDRTDSQIRNWQTRCCTPQSFSPESESRLVRIGWDADLEAAKSVISTSVFAGTVEDFDKSMVLLEALLLEHGIEFDAAYISQNVSPPDPERKGDGASAFIGLLGEPLHRHLVEINEMDYALLDLVRARVDESFSSLGDSENRLEEFRKRCRVLADRNLVQTLMANGRQKLLGFWHRIR